MTQPQGLRPRKEFRTPLALFKRECQSGILRTKRELVKCRLMALIDLNERDVDKWTLRLVIERGALAFECRTCWHLSQIDVLGLVERFGAEALVSELSVKIGTRSLGQCQITAHRGNMDDCSIRAFALKPRAFGAPLGGVGA